MRIQDIDGGGRTMKNETLILRALLRIMETSDAGCYSDEARDLMDEMRKAIKEGK